jgi:hypothetical protein
MINFLFKTKEIILDNKQSMLLHLLYLLAGFFIAYHSYSTLSLSLFEPALVTLQNVSASVFTLAGIWIAYSYKEAIGAFTDSKNISLIKGTESYESIKMLVLTIFASAFVLVWILIINLSKPIIISNPIFHPYIAELKVGFITLVFYLTIIQLKAILNIMINNFNFVFVLASKKAEREVMDDLSK